MQPLRCDFCGVKHRNGYCEDFLVMVEEEEDYCMESILGEEESHPKKQEKTSALEDALIQFMKMTQSNFKKHESYFKNQEASIKNLENQIGQLSKQLAEQTKESHPQAQFEESHDRDSYLNNVWVKFMRANQASFDNFEVRCERLSEQLSQFEQKKVEIESEHNFMVALEEELKNKNSDMEEDLRVRHGEIHVIAQLLGIEENRPPQDEFDVLQDKEWGKQYPKCTIAKAWAHLLPYAKYMGILSKRRKRKDEIFFMTYYPP